jgi:hypothetical protein
MKVRYSAICIARKNALVFDQEPPGPSHHLNDPSAIFYEYMYNLLFVQNKAITRFSNHFNSKTTMQLEDNEFKTLTVLNSDAD